MKVAVDPELTLMRSLTPGEPASLRQLALALNDTEKAVADSVSALTNVCEHLATPSNMLMLTQELDLLDPERFISLLDDPVMNRAEALSFSALCESTNRDSVLSHIEHAGNLSVAISEFQTGGRGRRGRTWHSGFAEGLCFTLAFRFAADISVQPTLTLAVGAAVATGLDPYVTEAVLLKWPNDLILGDGKLGGILVEVSSEPKRGSLVRIGVGINCRAPEGIKTSGELAALAPTGLSHRASSKLDRTRIAAELVNAIVTAVDLHQASGLAPFLDKWSSRDYLRHQAVQVFDDERVRHGTARGITSRGTLRVLTDDGELELASGEVRVRRR